MKKVAFILMLAIAMVAAGSNATTVRSQTQSGGELLRLLPDGNILAVIDVQRVTSSRLWATLSTQPKVKSALDKMQSDISDVGVSLSDVQTIALVFSGKGISDPTVAVTGGFDQTEVLSRLRSNQKIKLTSELYKNHEVYRADSLPASAPGDAETPGAVAPARKSNETSFYFYDSKTVVVGSAASVRASVDARSGARASVAQNPKLTEGIGQNASAAVRFAINLTPSMTSGLPTFEIPIPDFSSVNLIFGAVDVASGVTLNATLRNATADHARSLADRLNGLLMAAKGLLASTSNPKMSAVTEALKSV
ncbi:MAG TPA: hypothetical protein VLU47_04705, partial [Blastocatellia bacterium]|nr:hypothetical protein [Blastocatellia bacterium]